MTAIAWNPSDVSSGLTLSGGNLTYTGSASPTTDKGVRADTPKSAGKWYWEVKATTSSATDTGVGIATAGASLSALGTNATNSLIVFNSGDVWFNGSSTGRGLGAINGKVVCFAVDLDNERVWVRLDGGTWLGTAFGANPSTNALGFDIHALFSSDTTACYPCAVTGGTSTDTGTANFGATAFTQAVPDGFTALVNDNALFVNVSSSKTGSGTSAAPNAPVSIATGNLLIFFVEVETGGLTFSDPAGWTRGPTAGMNASSCSSCWWWQIAASSTFSAPSTSWTGTNFYFSQCFQYRGTDQVSPIGATAKAEGLSTTVAVGAITTTRNQSTAAALLLTRNGGVPPTPTNFTQQISKTSIDGGCKLADEIVATSGSASDSVSVSISSDAWKAYLIELLTPTVEKSSSDQAASSLAAISSDSFAHLAAEQASSSQHLLDEQASSSNFLVNEAWNPNDKDSGITLTNYNLTATPTAGNAAVRATRGRSSGKYYFELHIDNALSDKMLMGAVFAGTLDSASSSTKTITQVNGTEVPAFPYYGFAYDLDAKKFYLRVGAQFDELGAGFAAGALYPYFRSSLSGYGVTLNEGATPFHYIMPSGYSAWNGAANEALSSDIVAGEAASSDYVAGAGWNPSDRTSVDVVLTNTNKTATLAASGGAEAIRANVGHSSGKFYFEVTANFLTANWNRYVGIYGASGDMMTVDLPNAVVLAWVESLANDTIGFFFDFDNHQWGEIHNGFVTNFSWPTGARTGELFPFFHGFGGDVATINLGATPFVMTPPVGFVAWIASAEAASGAPQAYPYWNENDKDSGITLSNLDQTLTTSGVARGVRSVRGHTTGKWYAVLYNINFPNDAANNKAMFGLADSTRALSGTSDSANAAVLLNFGGVNVNNGGSTYWTLTSLSDRVVEMAADMEKGRIWFRLDGAGNWNNTPGDDPVTGVGGVSLRSLAWNWTELFLYACPRNAGDYATVAMIDFELPSSFGTYSPPTGFAWWNDDGASSAFALEQASSLAAISSDHMASEAASDKKLHDAASSALLAEQAEQASSSNFLLAQEHSSDKLIHDAMSSSDHLDFEQASSSDKLAHDAASSEHQSDLTHEQAPPIQVVVIVS